MSEVQVCAICIVSSSSCAPSGSMHYKKCCERVLCRKHVELTHFCHDCPDGFQCDFVCGTQRDKCEICKQVRNCKHWLCDIRCDWCCWQHERSLYKNCCCRCCMRTEGSLKFLQVCFTDIEPEMRDLLPIVLGYLSRDVKIPGIVCEGCDMEF